MMSCDDCRDRRAFLREIAIITAAAALSVDFATGQSAGGRT